MKVPVEGGTLYYPLYTSFLDAADTYIGQSCLDNGVGFLMDALAVAMRIFGRVMPCQSSFLSPSKDHRPAGGWGGGANERSGSVLMVSACLHGGGLV
jgi:hypothetical protein